MRKIITLLQLLLIVFSVKAEDVLQVVPFSTQPGVVEDDWEYFSMEMVNTLSYTALQFDLYLPEGMTLISKEPMELSSNRFPGVTRKGVFKPDHKYECTKMNDGHYFITIYHTEFAPIEGNNGELLTFYYETAEDMPSGYYPIKVTGTVLAVNSHTDTKPEASMSFVKIGDPAPNAMLDMGDYNIPSFVDGALPAQNVIRNGVCDNLVLADGYNFVTGGDFCATSATYTRPLVATWGTLCLPFALNSDETVQYYKLVSASDEAMTFEPVTTVEAGEPVVFKSLSGDVLGIHAGDVTVTEGSKTKAQEANGWTMRGTYTAFDNNPAECGNAIYYIADNRFWFADQTFRVGTFRGWFEAPEAVGEKTRAFTIFEGENPTEGVEYVEHADGSVSIVYDLSGRHRRAPQRGINIHNDKKIIKR